MELLFPQIFLYQPLRELPNSGCHGLVRRLCGSPGVSFEGLWCSEGANYKNHSCGFLCKVQKDMFLKMNSLCGCLAGVRICSTTCDLDGFPNCFMAGDFEFVIAVFVSV